ncbi:MAG: hypothetical protein M3404_12570, partial [Actinomycetota bacterium]|nr:hypothetical protein [Actinomycetota bacterium]
MERSRLGDKPILEWTREDWQLWANRHSNEADRDLPRLEVGVEPEPSGADMDDPDESTVTVEAEVAPVEAEPVEAEPVEAEV